MLMVSFASAETRIYNAVLDVNNDTWRNQVMVDYNANEFTSLQGGEGVTFYLDYKCDIGVDAHNVKYPSAQIENITLYTQYSPVRVDTNGDTIFLEEINTTEDLTNVGSFPTRKQWFTIYNKESVIIRMDTIYIGAGALRRDSPCYFDVNFGTEGCDRCREIAYYEFVADVNEANTIESYNENVKERIVGFLRIQYEFAIILYWILMIAITLLAIAIFIYAVFWLFHYLSHFFADK